VIKQKFSLDPFIFLTNGKDIWFWDRERYPERKIAGFYTRDDLERLAHQRRFAEHLGLQAINERIAGRDYQSEAIRRVTEAKVQSEVLANGDRTGRLRTRRPIISSRKQSSRYIPGRPS
jgi:type I restriction enzyme R subunit